MTTFNITKARSNFPALLQDQVFFDNAGGSQTLSSVIESIRAYLTQSNVQLGGTYRTSQLSGVRYQAGEEAGASFMNAQEDEIVYGSSTTQLLRNLSFAINFKEGDEIIVSCLDHEANIAPWEDIAQRLGLKLKLWAPPSSKSPKLLPEDLDALLSPNTKLVACTHVSNILGTINDIRGISEKVHTVPGAMLCVDGVSYAPHRQIDVKELGADFYTFSWYKVFGPHIAILYASRKAQEQIRSLGHFFQSSATLENKLGLAGASYELMQAIPAVVDYIGPSTAGGWKSIEAQEFSLQSMLLDYLNARSDVTIYGETTTDPKVRVPTVSFRLENWNSRDFVQAVEKNSNYGLKWGSFYSVRLNKEILGLADDGVVRVSMVHYNTIEEVQGLIVVFEKILSSRESS